MERNSRRARLRLALLLPVTAVLVGAGLVAPPPAAAATTSCIVALYSTSCTTDVLRANGRGHFVDIRVSTPWFPRGANWYLIDYDIGRTVASGHVNRNSTVNRRIGGLYGQYALLVADTLGDTSGRLDNE